jgi:hypothetical protein
MNALMAEVNVPFAQALFAHIMIGCISTTMVARVVLNRVKFHKVSHT